MFRIMLKNTNQPQFIPSGVKKLLKLMAMEQGLYAKVVMIHQKHLDNKKEQKKTKRYNFQSQPARSIRWFYLDQEWLEEKFSTHEPDF